MQLQQTAPHPPTTAARCPCPQCGCKCTQCCFQGNASNCTAVSMGTCPYECLEKSKTECGVRYSTARQSFFCAIPNPSSWPAVLQVCAAAVAATHACVQV